ncbi:MAG: bifunctional phosphopantothenoylcysteine decarboxylase/phosphopantothenate--cysteine ligase CoaBC [Alphaproteobacteria bacterium]|nr:bifunctional phosphopantothenoylcysteine decarboxylase/phosphopantothenate--cysteine ligase CoaBC [Alphaproteobacteria bacterium]
MDAIIEALGGAAQVQTLLGVGPSAVSNYRARGQFPEYARIRIWQALKARGITVDPETLSVEPSGQANPIASSNSTVSPSISPATGLATVSIPQSPRILLIISGGIAAYKSLELIRRIKDKGWHIRCIMTASAEQFITPLSVSALSGETTYTELFSLTDEAEMGHIRLAREADAIVIAPATANIMAKMAYGFADDLATTVLLATDAPTLIAPAMNPFMWAHPATQANQRQLKIRGVSFVGPDSGDMACGEDGAGRLAEIPQIINAISRILPGNGRLNGKTALVTSGPTHEPIDRVRYIANRSSGKQGHAIAAALARQGAKVTLISGPVDIPPPAGVHVVAVETAQDMLTASLAAMPVDIAICAAAVGDFSVVNSGVNSGANSGANSAAHKIKKSDTGDAPQLFLQQNPDILATIADHKMRPRLVIGFAAETDDVVNYAIAKRLRKKADWILANDVGQDEQPVFGSDFNMVHLVTENGVEPWSEMSKHDLADQLVSRIAKEISA